MRNTLSKLLKHPIALIIVSVIGVHNALDQCDNHLSIYGWIHKCKKAWGIPGAYQSIIRSIFPDTPLWPGFSGMVPSSELA